jgi:integrase
MSSEPLTLFDLLERYALMRSLKGKSVELYEMLIARLSRFLGREATVADLDDLVISRYLRWRAETPGWKGRVPSPASVQKDRVMLAAIWTYAARKRLAAEFPELPRIKVPKRIPTGRAYTADDVAALIRTAKRRKGKTGGLPSSWWWSTLLYCIYCTGERFEAATSLRWGDVDLAGCRVIYRGETRKGATRDIERQITPQLSKMLAEHQGPDNALVWPWDRRSRSQWASLKVLCRSARVKYRGFHGLRRTAASYAALAGGRAAATQLLDHSDPNLQRVYVDPAICPTESNSTAALPPLDLGEEPAA